MTVICVGRGPPQFVHRGHDRSVCGDRRLGGDRQVDQPCPDHPDCPSRWRSCLRCPPLRATFSGASWMRSTLPWSTPRSTHFWKPLASRGSGGYESAGSGTSCRPRRTSRWTRPHPRPVAQHRSSRRDPPAGEGPTADRGDDPPEPRRSTPITRLTDPRARQHPDRNHVNGAPVRAASTTPMMARPDTAASDWSSSSDWWPAPATTR